MILHSRKKVSKNSGENKLTAKQQKTMERGAGLSVNVAQLLFKARVPKFKTIFSFKE